MQRLTPHAAARRLAFADCVLDPAARFLWRDGEPVHVQPKVMELLLCLLQHRERFVSKQELQRALWADVVVGAASLPRLIKELRRALGDPADEPRLIRTLHGRGYQFIGEPVSVQAADAPLKQAASATAALAPLDATRTGSESGLDQRGSCLQLRTLHPDGSLPLALSSAAPLRIGRSAECDLVLPFEGVSRQHAELALVGPTCTLRDLDSRNGVFVDGEKLPAPAVLRCGQLLRIDGWVGLLEPSQPVAHWPHHPTLQLGSRLGSVLQPVMRADLTEPVLIEGETGTGKSVIAGAIHDWSRRRGRLLVLDAASAEGTDPDSSWAEVLAAAWEAARGGTLLLEDVETLSLAQQDQLLARWRENDAVHGESSVRLLATSQGAVHARVGAGKFRADLFARLSRKTLALPPLRARVQDIPGLFRHALLTHNGNRAPALSPRLVEALCLYDWPFNVRELSLVARNMLLHNAAEARLSRRHLRPGSMGPAPMGSDAGDDSLVSALRDALRDSEGDLEQAAASAGVGSPEARHLLREPRVSQTSEWGRAV